MQNNDYDIDVATESFLNAMKWTNEEQMKEFGDVNISGMKWMESAKQEAREVVEDFFASALEAAEDSEEYQKILENMDPDDFGYDFLLTRDGHGAGFWDRGLGSFGDWLSKQAKVYGGVTVDCDLEKGLLYYW